MKKLLLLLTGALFAGNLLGQQFRPYHAYGVQLNVNSSTLGTEHTGSDGFYKAGEDMNGTTGGFDVFVQYDYGALKWLGVGTGLGFSKRGGSSSDIDSDGKRNLSYLNIPVKLQFKPWHFLWVEAGVEVLYFLSYQDEGNFGARGVAIDNEPFDADGINNMTLSFVPALRFNLFRGLSLNAGYSMGLGNAAEVEVTQPITTSSSYKNFSAFIGVRYMIGQPEKSN